MLNKFHSALKMHSENLFDHRAAVPEKYIYISAVPGYSHVMYCLPRQSFTPSSTLNVTALRKHIVVVKVRRRPKIANEHATLLAIRRATGPEADAAKQHFLDFLDVDDLTSGSDLALKSLILPAILPSVTLADWSNAAVETENPVVWVYHVFLSLGTALRFLRQECGIEHGDVHDGNVLLRLTDGIPFGLPELVLIDSESRREVGNGEGEVSRDYFDFLNIVHSLAQEAESSADQTWAEFKLGLAAMIRDRKVQAKRRLEVSRFEELWREWEDVAVKGRSNAGQAAVDVTRQIFAMAVDLKREVVSDADLERRVQGVSSP